MRLDKFTEKAQQALQEAAELARETGGEDHHFRFVQLPFNLAMPEAYALPNQVLARRRESLLNAAAGLGIAVVGSATLSQGKLTRGLPDFVGRALGTGSDAESAIQFSRSAPGITTSLIGMSQTEHVARNLKVAQLNPASQEAWMSLFAKH